MADWLSHLESSPLFPLSPGYTLPPSPSSSKSLTSPSPAASILGKRRHTIQGSTIPTKRLPPATLTRQALQEMTDNEGRRDGNSFTGDEKDEERNAEVSIIATYISIPFTLTSSRRKSPHLSNHLSLPPPPPSPSLPRPPRRHPLPLSTKPTKRSYLRTFWLWESHW